MNTEEERELGLFGYSDLTSAFPPINMHSRLTIESPKPVPACPRVDEAST